MSADYISGKTDLVGFAFQPGLHHGLEPLVKDVMKVDVGEQGTDHLPLSRPRFADQQSAIFDHANLDPFPYQSQDCPVTDPLLDHLCEQTFDTFHEARPGRGKFPALGEFVPMSLCIPRDISMH